MSSAAPEEPEFRPRAVLRLGFAGHRPGRLKECFRDGDTWEVLEAKIENALVEALDHLEAAMRPFADELGGAAARTLTERWRDDYAPRKPLLRLVSGAAMGADQIALRAVQRRRDTYSDTAPTDWEIVAILPCEHELFIADASSDFQERFPSGGDEACHWRQILDIPDRLVVLASSWRTKVPGEPPGKPPPDLPGVRYIPRPKPIKPPVGASEGAAAASGGAGGPADWALDHTPTAEFLLGEIDILIVVWDQKEAKGPGGAPDLAAKAHEAGIPVLIINPRDFAPSARRLRGAEREPYTFETRHWYSGVTRGDMEQSPVDADHMAAIVRDALRRPAEGGGADIPGITYQDFLKDRVAPPEKPSVYDWIVRVFRFCGASSSHHGVRRLEAGSAPMTVEERWEAHLSKRPSPGGGRASRGECPQRELLLKTLLSRYMHAEALARGYGARYRETYTRLHFLAAFAATFAVLGLVLAILLVNTGIKAVLVFVEMGLLIWMYLAHRRSMTQGFHERYLDYGALAASLRQLRSLAAFSEFPRSVKRAESAGRWWQWYVMATAREIGPPDGELLPAWHRTVIRGLVEHELPEQEQRAREVLDECAGTEAGAHRLGWSLFVLTFCSLLALLVVLFFGGDKKLVVWFGAAAAALPIFGAALLGIVQTADFEARASRARLTIERISRQKEALQPLLQQQGYDSTRRALLATVRLAARDLEAFLKLHTHRPLVMPS